MNQTEIIERSILKGLTVAATLKAVQKEYPNSKLDEGDVKFTALQMSRAGYITDDVAKQYCQEVTRKPRTTAAPTKKPRKAAKAESTEEKPTRRRRGRPAKEVAKEAAEKNGTK